MALIVNNTIKLEKIVIELELPEVEEVRNSTVKSSGLSAGNIAKIARPEPQAKKEPENEGHVSASKIVILRKKPKAPKYVNVSSYIDIPQNRKKTLNRGVSSYMEDMRKDAVDITPDDDEENSDV